MSFSKIKEVIYKIADTLRDRLITINITGGEPFLYPKVFELLFLLEDIDNIKGYNIITNGIMLKDSMINDLNNLKKFKELKVSLEGDDAETNDQLRGRGVFHRVMMNMNQVRKSFKKEIILMFTLGRYNYQHLNGMLKLARGLGVDGVIIERFVPWGRGLLLKNQYLNKDEWRRIIEDIIRFVDIDYTPRELIPYKAFHITFKKTTELKGALCNLGDESMALMPDGIIFPCRRFPTKIGNIIHDDFNEILLRLKILKESIIENLKGRCGTCKIKGCFGCRAIAYAINEDFYTEDPQCFL